MKFEPNAVAVIKSIPKGKVATYAQVATLAGNHRGARQVVRVLHSLSDKEGLPWHRVISSRGTISLPRGKGFEEQRDLLATEGIAVGGNGEIDLASYGWEGGFPGSGEGTRFLKALTASPVHCGRARKPGDAD